MPRSVRVTDTEPRFEMWSTTYPEGVTEILFAQFGAQAPTLDEANSAISELVPLVQQGDVPTVLDRGQFVDAYGYAHATLMVYWFDPEAYARWAAQPAVDEFWSSRPLSGPVGYYREIAVIPRDHIETLYTPHDSAAPDEQPWSYYEHWVIALESVLAGSGLLSESALDDRTKTVLATPRTANHHEAHREPVAVDPALP